MERIINNEQGSNKGFIKGQDPNVRDARKIGQKFDKDVAFIIFIEKNKETNDFDGGTRIGLASWGNDPVTTNLGNYISNIVMQVVRGEVHKVIKAYEKQKVTIATEEDLKDVIRIDSFNKQLKKGD